MELGYIMHRSMADRFYELEGFEVLAHRYACVDGDADMVVRSGGMLRVVDVNNTVFFDDSKETAERVAAVARNYMRTHGLVGEIDEVGYDFFGCRENLDGVAFEVKIDPFEVELEQMPEKLDDAIEAAIEDKGWSFDYTTRRSVELEKDSPLGEDFVVEVDVRGFEKKLREYCKGFDPDDHAAMLVRHRGECGVPDSVLEIAQDAFAIQEMLDELCEAVELVAKLAAKDK